MLLEISATNVYCETVKYQKEFFINIANCLFQKFSSKTRKRTNYFTKSISATVPLGTCKHFVILANLTTCQYKHQLVSTAASIDVMHACMYSQ